MKNIISDKDKSFLNNSIDYFVDKLVPNPNLLINLGWGNLNSGMIKDIPSLELDKTIVCQYRTSQGEKDLIDNLVDFLFLKSKKKISADNIIITNGATNASFLLAFYFKTFLGHKKVFLQNPIYDTVANIFRSLDYKLETLMPDLSDLNGKSISLAWLIFKYHNPTGIFIGNQQRKSIQQKILRQGYLIEDDAYGLFHNDSCIDLSQHRRYVYVGSFSKYIFPGLRMGYIIANPEIIRALKEIQKYFNSHPNIISQSILNEILGKENRKFFLSDINIRKNELDEKRNLFWTGLSGKLKKNIITNDGGFYYWIKLKKGVKIEKPFKELLRSNVLVIPGDIYFIADPYPAFRVSVSMVDIENIPEAVRVLNNILDKYL